MDRVSLHIWRLDRSWERWNHRFDPKYPLWMEVDRDILKPMQHYRRLPDHFYAFPTCFENILTTLRQVSDPIGSLWQLDFQSKSEKKPQISYNLLENKLSQLSPHKWPLLPGECRSSHGWFVGLCNRRMWYLDKFRLIENSKLSIHALQSSV